MALLRDKDRIYRTPEDICTRLGEDYEEYYGAVNPPIYQTTLFAGHAASAHGYVYTRVANPTTEVAERKIAALEGADGALCFGAGMGAITAAILHFARSNGHIVMVATAYPDAKRFCCQYLKQKFNVDVTFVTGDDTDALRAAIRPETTLIYLESPSTTVFKMQDLEAVAAIAKSRGIGTAIDNTYATPLYQNPLKWGIDIVVHTVSKYLCGHSNVVGGVLCARREIIEAIQHAERSMLGSILGPQESYLLLMGLRTLPIRMKKHQENGRRIAAYLEQHPNVARVFHPGSHTYPQQALFQKYMSGSTSLISFIYDGTPQEAVRFVKALTCFHEGVSWGGFESLVSGKSIGMAPEQCRVEDVPANVIRLYIGLENPQTLLDDLAQAFDKSKTQV